MEKIYRIAEISIQIITPFDFEEDERYKDFSIKKENINEIDFTVLLEPCEMPSCGQKTFIEIGDNRYYQNVHEIMEECWEGMEKVSFRWLSIPYNWENHRGPQKWVCRYLHGMEDKFRYSSLIFRHIGLNMMLNQKRALLLHCSFIRLKETGILFSGPSGIGKSTQADLWNKMEQADILNGDRAVIRKKNNIWKAFGLPYAGSSNIYRNESAKIGAIIVLRKSSDNQIKRLTLAEAYRFILSEVFQNSWNTDMQMITLEVLEELIMEIPVFMLSCTADVRAVECLKKQLQEEQILK